MKRRLWIGVLLLPLALTAGETRYVEFSKKEAWLQGGDVSNLILTSRGEIKLGFVSSASRIKDELAAWSGVRVGDDLLIGTANGRIYNKAGAVVFETGEMVVTSMLRSGDVVYAATIPNGKIFKLEQGTWKEFARLESKYIWALAEIHGALHAACGVPGRVVRLSRDGRAQTVFEAKSDNVLAIAADGEDLLVGTAGPGALIRVTKGRGVVVRDFETGEVKSLAVVRGSVYAAVNAGAKLSPTDFIRGVQQSGPTEPRSEGEGKGAITSAVWKINEARAEVVAEFPNTFVNQLWPVSDGLYVATNTSGRIYKLLDDGSYELHYEFKGSRQAHGFIPEANAVLLGDRAQIGFMTGQRAKQGEYVSPVIDTRYTSQFGQVQIRASGRVTVQTRSGHVARPEDGWYDWSREYMDFPAKITSPRGRYFQFRVRIEDPNAVVSGVTVSYKNENQRPRVGEIKIETQAAMTPGVNPGADVNQQIKPPPTHSPIKRISWHASDPDGDQLVFRGFYRAEESDVWVPLLGGRPTGNTFIQWNTDSVPDGRYEVRIVASDEDANVREEALTGEQTSDPLLVDNSKPEVSAIVKDLTLIGVAQDKISNITRIEYQIDGGDWVAVVPKDRLLDSKREDFEVQLAVDGLSKGRHTVNLRAFDQELNAGLSSTTFDLK